MFITVEGIEGAGKSTHLQWIADFLRRHKPDLVVTREPGGTPLANRIRDLFLHNQTETMADDTELLLAFASRAQHLAEVIKPALDQGQWVLSDRFTDSTYAYQGAGRGIDIDKIRTLEDWIVGKYRPDFTFLFNVDLKISFERLDDRPILDRMESETRHFFQRVQTCYLERAMAEPERFVVIDTAASKEIVQAQVLAALEKKVAL